MKQKIYSNLPGLIFGVLVICFLVGFSVLAWTEPQLAPPQGNVPAPINTGGIEQMKSGALRIGGVFRTDTATYLAVSSGNVGIGTTAPGAKLEVAGQIKITGGSPGAGKVLTSDASGLASWGTITGTLPTGTSGQTLRNDGTNWLANSALSNDGTKITVNGTVDNLLTLSRSGAANSTVFKLGTDSALIVNSGGSDVLTLKGGKVGIGTTSPDEKLQISSGNIALDFGHSTNLAVNRYEIAKLSSRYKYLSTNVETPKISILNYNTAGTGWYEVTDRYRAGLSFYTIHQNSQIEAITIQSGGNVGIGTVSPISLLTIGTVSGNTTNIGNKLHIQGDTIGALAGNYVYPMEYRINTTYSRARTQFTGYRRVAGNDWQGTATRLQYAIDGVWTDGGKAYIEFGASDPNPYYDDNGFIALGTQGLDRLVVKYNGNVGIGTTNPGTNRLEVVGGPIKATGGLIIETRTTNPGSPATGQMWLCTDPAPYCQ